MLLAPRRDTPEAIDLYLLDCAKKRKKGGPRRRRHDAHDLMLRPAKILSGANTFEISDIQEDETEAVLMRRDPK